MRVAGTAVRSLIRIGLCGLFIALVGCAGSPRGDSAPAPQPSASAFEIVPREERRDLPAGTSAMRIENPHGDLRVRITNQPKVGFYAMVQRIGEQPLDPVFDWQQQGDRLQLTIRYPGEEHWPRNHDHSRGRVDLAVFVPAELALDLRTTDGFLQVRKARAAVRARSDSGSIEVSGAAELDLRSDSGAIAASQNSGVWGTPIAVHTRSGRIAIAVPVYADVAVDARTRGRIELEPGFPGTVVESEGHTQLQARFGAGSHELTVRSETGDILLRGGIPESVLQGSEHSGD